ncbi:chaperone protein DnaJ 1-like [Phlebotomus argentipes]|uniref:chaperone protein DnaJ 1-like n=1 Tax=Phlebotomus argentipes TaxID=94469 RepID=UPI0028934AD8|nr:chaperone protein DnaJ 1-like [Phlebotomus argentipes]
MGDLYRILNVSRDANNDQIKLSYMDLARRYHPDRNSSPAAEEHFKMIAFAYRVLSDKDTRRKYDQQGETAFRNGGIPRNTVIPYNPMNTAKPSAQKHSPQDSDGFGIGKILLGFTAVAGIFTAGFMLAKALDNNSDDEDNDEDEE